MDAPAPAPLQPLRLLVGLAVGVAVWIVWWRVTGEELAVGPTLHPAPLLGGAALLTTIVALQVVRTATLFPTLGLRGTVRPVLVGHGINTLLGMAGDVAEAVWLVRASPAPTSETLGRLLYRAVGTAGGAALALGVGIGGIATLAGAGAMVFVAVVGHTGSPGTILGWTVPHMPPLGSRATWTHLAALVLQVAAGVAAIALVLDGVDTPIAWVDACAAFGAQDLATYAPVPLASLGLQQVAITWALGGDGTAWGASLHHALCLAVGLAALALTPGRLSQPEA